MSRAREQAHEECVAELCRDDRKPPTIDPATIRDASIRRQIENLRRHLVAIEHMLLQSRKRLDALEHEAAQ